MKLNPSKTIIIFIAVLAALTAIAAAVHFATRPQAPKGSILVESGEVRAELPLDSLTLKRVTGQMRTNKGEVRNIDEQGLPLQEVVSAAGFLPENCNTVRVVADDGYSATVTEDELLKDKNAYLIFPQGESPRLLVFEDSNSKRNVSNVVSIVVEYE